MKFSDFYSGKVILVTGGAGSIGSHLVKDLLQINPASVRIFDNNETGLFDLEQNLKSEKIRLLVGDVRDKERLIVAMEDVDYVFHAAALKHVPLCEFNPYDAVKTNIIGTQNVIEAAYIQGVKKVITISTDKAVSPSNVMGATKLLAERLTISANTYHGHKKTTFACVRFGNVLNSRGSVIPLFINQIEKGGPITVTHPAMCRFFMEISSATNLILKAGILSHGSEIFILKMNAMRIIDLAEEMRDYYAPLYGINPDDIAIEIIGMRNGEKLDEELIMVDETSIIYESEDMYLITPKSLPFSVNPLSQSIPVGFHRATRNSYSSGDVKVISKEEIKNEICKIGLSQ